MLVLAAVPTIQFHKLRRAAAPRFPVVHANRWDDALATIRSRPVELAAVDPQLEGSPSAREIERLRLLFPSLPLILYTALSPATAAVLLAIGNTGFNAAVFARLADHPARLREAWGSPWGPARLSSASPRASLRCPRRTRRRHERHTAPAAISSISSTTLHHPHCGGRRGAAARAGARAVPRRLPRPGRRL